MSAPIPEIEPQCLTAGDTLQWTRDLSENYPASSWTLTYYVIGGAKYTITATADGSKFSVSVPATTTKDWIAGSYLLKGYVTKAGERHEVYSAGVTIKADPAQMDAGTDIRTHAQKCLDAIEAVLENRASRDQLSTVIQAAGMQVQKIPHADLLKFRQFYQDEVLRQKQAEKIARGENTGNNVLVRFR